MRQAVEGQILVVLQFGLLAVLLSGSRFEALFGYAGAIVIAGLLLAASALWAMRHSRFRIRPQPHPQGSLVLHGPYRYLRHPMYSSLILIGVGLLCTAFSLPRLLLLLLIIVVLMRKAAVEEALLEQHYPGYAAGMRQCWRLLPGVY